LVIPGPTRFWVGLVVLRFTGLVFPPPLWLGYATVVVVYVLHLRLFGCQHVVLGWFGCPVGSPYVWFGWPLRLPGSLVVPTRFTSSHVVTVVPGYF